VLFVVPCRYEAARPVVFGCVESIRLHHPDARVVVVDSASEDRSYLEVCSETWAVDVLDVENRNYATNAYRLAFEAFPDEDAYGCIHDSFVVHDNLDDLAGVALTTVRHFESPSTPWGWDATGVSLEVWGSAELARIGIGCPTRFTGVMGPMWFASQATMAALVNVGFFSILPTDKYGLCAMERIAGIVFAHLGLDPANSLQGKMTDFFGTFDTTRVEKVICGRS
jgi:hypothetical protein